MRCAITSSTIFGWSASDWLRSHKQAECFDHFGVKSSFSKKALRPWTRNRPYIRPERRCSLGSSRLRVPTLYAAPRARLPSARDRLYLTIFIVMCWHRGHSKVRLSWSGRSGSIEVSHICASQSAHEGLPTIWWCGNTLYFRTPIPTASDRWGSKAGLPRMNLRKNAP